MTSADSPRSITKRERALLDFLLGEPFLGRDQIRRQLIGAKVRDSRQSSPLVLTFVTDPSLPLVPDRAERICPVSASGFDLDGEPVRLWLDLDQQGRVDHLHMTRVDRSPLLAFPALRHLTRHIQKTEPLEPPLFPDVTRDLTEPEREMIAFLLGEDIEGWDDLRQQLAVARVIPARSRDPEYIRLVIDQDAPLWPVDQGMGCVASAKGTDLDGMVIDVSLHVGGRGRLTWLDVIRLDGEPLLRYPPRHSLVRDQF